MRSLNLPSKSTMIGLLFEFRVLKKRIALPVDEVVVAGTVVVVVETVVVVVETVVVVV